MNLRSDGRRETAHLGVLPGIISVRRNRALFTSQQGVVGRVRGTAGDAPSSKLPVEFSKSLGLWGRDGKEAIADRKEYFLILRCHSHAFSQNAFSFLIRWVQSIVMRTTELERY